MSKLVEQLDQKTDAQLIHQVFQRAYQVEADLIGAVDFPPLAREVSEIKNSAASFIGIRAGHELAAVLEYTLTDQKLNIDFLGVDPNHFRKGFAGKLVEHVLNKTQWTLATVGTAAENIPARTLYERFGFGLQEEFSAPDGLALVKLGLVRTGLS